MLKPLRKEEHNKHDVYHPKGKQDISDDLVLWELNDKLPSSPVLSSSPILASSHLLFESFLS